MTFFIGGVILRRTFVVSVFFVFLYSDCPAPLCEETFPPARLAEVPVRTLFGGVEGVLGGFFYARSRGKSPLRPGVCKLFASPFVHFFVLTCLP